MAALQWQLEPGIVAANDAPALGLRAVGADDVLPLLGLEPQDSPRYAA